MLLYKLPVTSVYNLSLIASQAHKKSKQDFLSEVLHCKLNEMLPQSFKISTYKGLYYQPAVAHAEVKSQVFSEWQ